MERKTQAEGIDLELIGRLQRHHDQLGKRVEREHTGQQDQQMPPRISMQPHLPQPPPSPCRGPPHLRCYGARSIQFSGHVRLTLSVCCALGLRYASYSTLDRM